MLATVDSGSKLVKRPRVVAEYYREPEWAVRGLLDVQTFTSPSWDPACGSGTIPRVFAGAGITCFGTDLINRGCSYFNGEHDFLKGAAPGGVPDTWQSIVTNPPFSLAEEFLKQALAMAQHKVALLLRLSWMEGQKRRWVWNETPLAAIHPFASRVSMPPANVDVKAKGGAVAFAWFVWDLGWPRSGGAYLPPIVTRIERGPND
jgi:hypothetical protein